MCFGAERLVRFTKDRATRSVTDATARVSLIARTVFRMRLKNSELACAIKTGQESVAVTTSGSARPNA
jgi:hypothetical protein